MFLKKILFNHHLYRFVKFLCFILIRSVKNTIKELKNFLFFCEKFVFRDEITIKNSSNVNCESEMEDFIKIENRD